MRPGTGLGLPIARGLVEALGGRIAAASRSDGRGSVFSIWLAGAAPSMEQVA